jgi:transcriptional regulator with PAS, ATPase and Fis domain
MNPDLDLARAIFAKARDKETELKLAKQYPHEYNIYQEQKQVNIWLKKFITSYQKMLELKDRVRILSEADDPVLIMGETGTGKELLARALHGERSGAFVPINCAGIPDTLIESILFGHVKGAFTGASGDKEGLLRTAYDGSIFLDEIGDLPLSVQAKLLRALQEKTVRPVGSDVEQKINCRFICATHKFLQVMVINESFRADLYWRICTCVLHTLPLRERTADIPLIVKQLIIEDKGKINYDIEDIEEFCEPIIDMCKSTKGENRLNGNVRELIAYVRNYHLFGTVPKI